MTPRWTLVDFVLVVLGGLGGTLAAGLGAGLLDSAGSDLTVIIAILGQYLGHLGVLWLIGRGRDLDAASLGFDIAPGDVLYLGLGVALQVALVVVFIPLQQILVPDGGNPQEVVDVIQQLGSPAARTAAVVVTTFLAPLTEEVVFRGVLLKSLEGRGRRLVMVVTATVFAVFHLIGVTSLGAGVLVFLQIFVVGVVLAHVTLRRGRLGPAIFLHAGFNLLAALVLLLPAELIEQLTSGG
ncbi:MAG TPA: CPBP family intramembrane glutamic endopeptidase [Acidimicrobiia bacterium]|nr:CPBP family intramembrane glutamic endopeptidase [Acidimicrobiia bacterium]